MADIVLFPTSEEGRDTLMGGRMVLTVLGCGVTGLPARGPGSALTEVRGDAVLVVDVGDAADVLAVEGGITFTVLGCGVESFPGAGGAAVLRELSRDVEILPAGGTEAVLESFWEGVGFLPMNGAGAALMVLGLEVIVVFLVNGETMVFAVEGGDGFFLGLGVFVEWPGGGWGVAGLGDPGSGFVLSGLGLDGNLGFFADDILAAVIGVVGVVAVVVCFAVVVVGVVVAVGAASSASGFTTTKEVTGVTKLYFRERLVAFSASNL